MKLQLDAASFTDREQLEALFNKYEIAELKRLRMIKNFGMHNLPENIQDLLSEKPSLKQLNNALNLALDESKPLKNILPFAELLRKCYKIQDQLVEEAKNYE